MCWDLWWEIEVRGLVVEDEVFGQTGHGIIEKGKCLDGQRKGVRAAARACKRDMAFWRGHYEGQRRISTMSEQHSIPPRRQ